MTVRFAISANTHSSESLISLHYAIPFSGTTRRTMNQ